MINIFDPQFNGIPRSELYRAQVTPELFPHEPRVRIENWSDEEREMFCGIYTDARRAELAGKVAA